MSTTTTNRNLIAIIVMLILTNIGVLAYFLWFKPAEKADDRDKLGITEMLEKEVGFTNEQLTTYKQMKDVQKKRIHPLFEEMRKAKEELFRQLGDTTASQATLEQLADTIGQRQKAIDLQIISYFREVRKLCTPEQTAKYDSVIIRAFRKMGRPAKTENKK